MREDGSPFFPVDICCDIGSRSESLLRTLRRCRGIGCGHPGWPVSSTADAATTDAAVCRKAAIHPSLASPGADVNGSTAGLTPAVQGVCLGAAHDHETSAIRVEDSGHDTGVRLSRLHEDLAAEGEGVLHRPGTSLTAK